MKTITLIVTAFLVFNGLLFSQADSVKFKSLKPGDFQHQYLLGDKALLIDVREFFEFKSKRIKGAINIPASGNMDLAADTMNRDLSLFLYCTSGFRSSKVAKSLYDKGFRKIYSLDGGITEWQKEGMKVDKSRVKKKR